jgi:hypothetical protein
MSRSVPKSASATKSQSDCVDVAEPRARQMSLLEREHDDLTHMRSMLKRVMTEMGGVLLFAERVDLPSSTVSRAFNGIDSNEVNLRHITAMLDDAAFATVFVRWLCLRTGHEPPVKRRVDRPAEEKLAALVKAARKAGVAGAALLDAAADELDMDKENF